jgi:hypothetical protein
LAQHNNKIFSKKKKKVLATFNTNVGLGMSVE